MDFQSMKEYTRLNLQRSGLKLSAEDQKKADKLKGPFAKIGLADRDYAPFAFEVRDNQIGRFWYCNMSIAYWCLVVCMSVLGIMLDEYLDTGAIPVTNDFVWAYFILPAVFLVGRLFAFSLVNIAHLVLLALCVVMSIMKIRIFGNELNWIWVFIVVGTIITLIGRVWEGTHDMKKNKQWYKENVQTLKNSEAAIQEATPAYNSIGADAEAELKRKYPGTKREARTPWFAFQRKLEYKKKGSSDDKCEPILPNLPQGKTDFTTLQESRSEMKKNERVTVWTEVTITGQKMGYEEIDRYNLESMLKDGSVKPFFGMAVPELTQGLVYRRYIHHWNAETKVRTLEHYETVRYEKSKARREAEIDLQFDELELDRLEKKADLDGWESMAAYQMRKEYDAKKQEYLDSFEDDEVRTWHGDSHVDEKYDRVYETAVIEVYTPDKQLVGLYCGETENAIKFAANVAAKHWGARITAGSTPSSEAQKGYLYREFIAKA